MIKYEEHLNLKVGDIIYYIWSWANNPIKYSEVTILAKREYLHNWREKCFIYDISWKDKYWLWLSEKTDLSDWYYLTKEEAINHWRQKIEEWEEEIRLYREKIKTLKKSFNNKNIWIIAK